MHVTVHSSIRVKFAVKSLSTGSGKTLQDRIDQDSDRFDSFVDYFGAKAIQFIVNLEFFMDSPLHWLKHFLNPNIQEQIALQWFWTIFNSSGLGWANNDLRLVFSKILETLEV